MSTTLAPTPAIDAYVRSRLSGRSLLIVGQAPRHAEGDRIRPDRDEPFCSSTGDRIAVAAWGPNADRWDLVARTDRINLNPALLPLPDRSRSKWDPFHARAGAVVAGRLLAALDEMGDGPRAIIACGRKTSEALGVPFQSRMGLGDALAWSIYHPGGTNLMLNDPTVRESQEARIREAFEWAGLA